jgi:DHA1 family multidrug resistance protein-like MFS transporter
MEAYRQYRHLKRSVQQETHTTPSPTPSSLESSNTNEDKSDDTDDKDASSSSTQNNNNNNNNNNLPVTFTPSDANDPTQWSTRRKLFCTAQIWLLVFVTGWASASESTAHSLAAKALHVSEVSESLATSMYLFGVAIGAVFAGPFSETCGRLPTYLATFAVYLIWLMASALSPNFGAQVVFRGLAGLFASASMSIYGGSLADLYETEERAKVWPWFALSPLLGPVVAPVASGWVAQELGWRWVDWLTLIVSGGAFVVAVLFLPETSKGAILKVKARMMRQETGHERYIADGAGEGSVGKMLLEHLQRMAHFIFREMTTLLFGLYLTLLYLLIYGFLEGFDFLFTDTYRFDTGRRYSAFAAIAVGILLGLPYILTVNKLTASRNAGKQGQGQQGQVEQRLIPALLPSILLTISMFWIGWTDRADISDFSVLGACCLFGFSLMALFTTTYHYLIDAYGTSASSAMCAATFMRYMASGGMVMATEPLYLALHVEWTLTLFGCVAGVLTPVPWVFWWYGSKLREKSKYAE